MISKEEREQVPYAMRKSPRLALLYLIFLLSGGAGLIYQVIWVRVFGNLFGSSVLSAALVTAIFMSGLGVGSYLAGRYADRRAANRPINLLRAYAYIELVIAAMAFGVALALPQLESLSATISSYVVGEAGWWSLSAGAHALRYATALVLLMPVTLMMGATLTVLVRYLLQRELTNVSWRVGLLYGFNTLGAAMGCLLTDFLLVPLLGLLATSSVAVSLNLVAGLGALRLSRNGSAPQSAPRPRDLGEGPHVRWSAGVSLVCVTLFLSGFTGMGLEIVWFRILTSTLGEFRAVFSLLLAVILVGIWIGSVAAGALERRIGKAPFLLSSALPLYILIAVAGIYWFDSGYKDVGSLQQALSESSEGLAVVWVFLFRLKPIVMLVGAPAVLMGATYPLANAIVQRSLAQVGRRAGALYLMNTLGGVLGSLVAGFLFIPRLGMDAAVLALGAAGLTATVPLILVFRRSPVRRRWYTIPFGLLGGAGAMLIAWSLLPRHFIAEKALTQAEHAMNLLTVSEGQNETVIIVEFPDAERGLYTNGYLMTGTHLVAQRYMRAFSHLPLLHQDDPRKALVVCFGVGNTLHAASLHPSIEALEVVDLSRNVLGHAAYFERWNRGVLEDPRVKVFVNDGRQHLRMGATEAYDLITLEPPPIAFAGVSALYSAEFYRLAHARLKRGGFVTQWLPAYQVPGPVALSVIRSFLEVFPNAILLSGYRRHLMLVGMKGGAITLTPEDLKRRLAARPAVKADLDAIEMGSLTALFGTFVADAATLREATKNAVPVTDDYPLMEFDSVSVLRNTRIPPEIFAPEQVTVWCPTCFEHGRWNPAAADLGLYLSMLDRLYSQDSFLGSRNPRAKAGDGPIRFRASADQVGRVMTANPYLRRLFPGIWRRIRGE